MQTLRAAVQSELSIRKSRFLCCVQPMTDWAAALLVVQRLRSEHPNAAHVCWDGVLATVVRYFGGVKLGAGGLVRACTDAVAQALQSAGKVPLERQLLWTCTVPHELEDWLRRQVQGHGVTLATVSRGEAVAFDLAGAESALHTLRAQLDAARGARLRWSTAGSAITR